MLNSKTFVPKTCEPSPVYSLSAGIQEAMYLKSEKRHDFLGFSDVAL